MVWTPHPRYVTSVLLYVIIHHERRENEWETEKLRGLEFNLPNVVKWYLVAHVSRYYFTEVRYFFMDVLQKGQAIPPSKIHDHFITLS